MHRCLGMNALRTSASLVKLLTLSTDQIHPFTVFDQVFQKVTIVKECPKAPGPLCMHVRNGTTHPVKWTARSSGTALGMMIMVIQIFVRSLYAVIEVCSRKSREARYLIHKIIPRRRRQGVIRVKIIVVIVRRTGHRQAHAGDRWEGNLIHARHYDGLATEVTSSCVPDSDVAVLKERHAKSFPSGEYTWWYPSRCASSVEWILGSLVIPRIT